MCRDCLAATLVGVLMLAAPAAVAQQKWTDATNRALRGPVHTQRLSSRKLREDPRANPKLPILSPDAWLAFDRQGNILENSNSLSADGTPEVLVRYTRDSEGRETGSTTIWPDRVEVWHTETQSGPQGVIETRIYRGDELQTRLTTDYDERGNAIEQDTYDGNGAVVVRSFYRYDPQGRVIDWEVRDPNDRVSGHSADRYDADGDLMERDNFDRENRIVISLALRKGRLVSWWQQPDCDCTGSVGFGDPSKGASTRYDVGTDGKLEITVENFSGPYGAIENDSEERHDEAGNLLEEVTFQYERDRYGNWITRIISAWETKTDTLVPIQEDHREITFYK